MSAGKRLDSLLRGEAGYRHLLSQEQEKVNLFLPPPTKSIRV